MNIQQAFEHINQLVFKTIHLKNITVKEITNIKNTYPYFTLTRYLLAYQKKEKFQNITLEASLQQNPLWFGYVLENMDKKTETLDVATTLKKESENKSAHDVASSIEKKITPKTTIIHENTSATIQPDNTEIDNTKTPSEEQEKTPETMVVNEIVFSTKKLENTDTSTPSLEKENNKINMNIPNETNTLSQKEENEIKNTTHSPIIPLYVEDYFGAINLSLPEPKKQEIKLITSSSETKIPQQEKPFIDWLDEFSATYSKNNPAFSSEKSKNDTPVASETMAEIWIAEKRYDKAILTYEKLSLLFPEKSIYFAEKISELKNRLNR